MQSRIGFDYLGVQKGVSLLIFVILIEIISKNELSSLPRLIYRIKTSRTNVGLTLKFGFGSLQFEFREGIKSLASSSLDSVALWKYFYHMELSGNREEISRYKY